MPTSNPAFVPAFARHLRAHLATWPYLRLSELGRVHFNKLDPLTQGLVLTCYHDACVELGIPTVLDDRCACCSCCVAARVRRWREEVGVELGRAGFV
jgi:hypothetical protein